MTCGKPDFGWPGLSKNAVRAAGQIDRSGRLTTASQLSGRHGNQGGPGSVWSLSP